MIITTNQFHHLFGSGIAPGVDDGDYAAPGDRRVLLALSRCLRPRCVVEIGIQRGTTAALLLRESAWIEQYVGIDVPPDTVLARQQRELPQHAGELAAADPRLSVLLIHGGSEELRASDPRLPRNVDMVYIDGDHSEAAVRADTDLARAVVRPGGVIAWHDYPSEAGVRAVIDGLNRAEGDHIALVHGSWVCFELVGARD